LNDLTFILPEQLLQIQNKILHYIKEGLIKQTGEVYILNRSGKNTAQMELPRIYSSNYPNFDKFKNHG